jgi:hypothetical protein
MIGRARFEESNHSGVLWDFGSTSKVSSKETLNILGILEWKKGKKKSSHMRWCENSCGYSKYSDIKTRVYRHTTPDQGCEVIKIRLQIRFSSIHSPL